MVTKAQTRERIGWLREDLLKAPPKHFDMGSWWYGGGVTIGAERTMKRFVDASQGKWSCNTTACAAGVAAMDPRFQALGLSVTVEPGRLCQNQGSIVLTHPRGRRLTGISAMAAVLGVECSVAEKLFASSAPVRGRAAIDEVVAKLDQYLDTGDLDGWQRKLPRQHAEGEA